MKRRPLILFTQVLGGIIYLVAMHFNGPLHHPNQSNALYLFGVLIYLEQFVVGALLYGYDWRDRKLVVGLYDGNSNVPVASPMSEVIVMLSYESMLLILGRVANGLSFSRLTLGDVLIPVVYVALWLAIFTLAGYGCALLVDRRRLRRLLSGRGWPHP
jgi:hypothetical protein